MATVAPSRVRTGRGVEIALLLLALTLGIGAYALVGLATGGSLPAGFGGYAATLAAIAVGLHLILRWRAPYADPLILPIVMALNGIGLAMIHRIDLRLDARGLNAGFGDRQELWTIIGAVCAAVVLILLRDHRTLRRYTYTAMIVGLVLLLLPMLPGLGVNLNGAQVWVRVGPFSVQPAEFAKIALAVFFAGYLVTHRDVLTLAGPKILGLQLPRLRDFGPIVLAWAVSILVLVRQTDLGSSLLFFGLFVAMLYVATERWSWILIGLLMFAVGAVLAANIFGHVGARVDVWLHALDPEIYNRDPGGSGQVVRGLFGMASGGLFGTGWGEGYPDLVPYANSDFIMASLGEELGLTGVMAVLMLYLILVQRGIRTSIGLRDGFGKLLASGLSFVIALQCFVVVGGVTRLIPLTGLTMPFLASGGSSLVANWIVVGLLLRMSDGARRPAGEGGGGLVSTETSLEVVPGDAEPPARDRDPGDTGEFASDDQHTEVVERP